MDNNMNTTDNMNSVNATSPAPVGNGKMREKYTRIWAWMGIPGLIVALTAGNREEELTKNHLNHAIGMDIIGGGIGLTSWIFSIPYLGWALAVICILPLIAFAVYSLVVFIMGVVKACHDQPVDFFIFNLFHIIK